MSIDFSTLQGLTIPEGVVTQIADASGRVLWALANDEPIVLEVEKITATTYAGETSYDDESFILLDIYPKTSSSTVDVTYGGLTKTLTFSGTNAQQVFFGTFNGVSDSVATPASGTLTIEGACAAFAVGTYISDSKGTTSWYYGITAVTDFGSVKTIPDGAFYQCTEIVGDIIIPDGVTSIGATAFHLTKITSAIIPASVTYMGSNCFGTCNNLTAITVLATTPPTIGTDDTTSTLGTFENFANITVPVGCVEAYRAANGWCKYAIVEAS